MAKSYDSTELVDQFMTWPVYDMAKSYDSTELLTISL